MKHMKLLFLLAVFTMLAATQAFAAVTVPVEPLVTLETADIFSWAKYILIPAVPLILIGIAFKLAPKGVKTVKKSI